MNNHRSLTAITAGILLLCCFLGSSAALNCTVALPRLLLGNQYQSTGSNETALIMFDTLSICKNATLLPSKDSNFTFVLKDIVAQVVDTTLSHGKKNVELVQYEKYSIIFAINAVPGTTYSVSFQGDSSDETTVYSETYSFKLPSQDPSSTAYPKIMFYGDQDLTTRGMTNIDFLKANGTKFDFDAFIFLGDYAYEFYQNNGQKGDAYVEQLSPLTFNFPMVWTPGNHEDNLNFTLFNEKFELPGFNLNQLNNFNSFNIGNIHFIHLNLDYFSLNDNYIQQLMLTWLTQDLKSVNRQVYPWVIAVGHKLINCYDPLYAGNPDCLEYIQIFSQFDSIFATLGVDMFITGHQHYNQIMAPMYNKTIQSFNYNKNVQVMTNYSYVTGSITYEQGGYISLIQGNGGCITSPNGTVYTRMLDDDINSTLKQASLYLNQENVGFGWIQVVNSTHLEYHSYDAENQVELMSITFISNHTLISTASSDPIPDVSSAERLAGVILCILSAIIFVL